MRASSLDDLPPAAAAAAAPLPPLDGVFFVPVVAAVVLLLPPAPDGPAPAPAPGAVESGATMMVRCLICIADFIRYSSSLFVAFPFAALPEPGVLTIPARTFPTSAQVRPRVAHV